MLPPRPESEPPATDPMAVSWLTFFMVSPAAYPIPSGVTAKTVQVRPLLLSGIPLQFPGKGQIKRAI